MPRRQRCQPARQEKTPVLDGPGLALPSPNPERGAASAGAAEMALRRGRGAPGSGGDGRWAAAAGAVRGWSFRIVPRWPWPASGRRRTVAWPRSVSRAGNLKSGRNLAAADCHRQAVPCRKLL